MTYKSKFNNGDKLRDRVTKFEGTVLCIAFYSTGCTHYSLQCEVKGNEKPSEWESFDESRLELVESNAIQFEINHEGSKNLAGIFLHLQ